MYYQTRIQKICAGGAIDIQGRKLSFMGNLPVQAGDSVWTDGNVIFGHVRTGDTPLISISQLKIPILGDTLRGYINQNGKYKEYDIIQDDWITNDTKIFKHGIKEYKNKNVIDAEIAENGNLYLATEGFYQKNHSIKYNNHLYNHNYYHVSDYHDGSSWSKQSPYYVYCRRNSYIGDELTLGIEAGDIDDDVIFYKNNEEVDRLNLKNYADLAIEKAVVFRDKIMQKSIKEGIDYIKQPPPPNSFIASNYARIITLKIQQNGNWDAVISASAYGYCFPYLSFNGSVFDVSFPNDEYKTFSSALEECMNNFEHSIYTVKDIPVTIEKYPAFVGDKKDDNGNWTAEYKSYILQKAEYYIPLARFKYYRWFPIIFNAFMLFKVHNGEIIDTVISRAGGGGNLKIHAVEWNEKDYINSKIYDNFVIQSEESKKDWSFILNDKHYFKANGMNIKAIYNTESNEKIVDIPEEVNFNLHENYYEAYLQFPLEYDEWSNLEDSISISIEHEQNFGNARLWGHYYFKPHLHYKFVTSTNTQDIVNQYPKKEEYSYLDLWLEQGADESLEINHALNFNNCFAEYKKGKYLIGLHKGKLIKFDKEGNIEELGKDLKNFRLRELKKISMAREQSQ